MFKKINMLPGLKQNIKKKTTSEEKIVNIVSN